LAEREAIAPPSRMACALLTALGEDARLFASQSKIMVELMAGVDKIAEAADTTVLIEGETGTGKDWLARFIHWKTPGRAAHPLIAVDCASSTDAELEVELLGQEAGAFAGANPRQGALELAEAGTLLLDEVADMGLALQERVLELLQSATFKRAGGTRDGRANVRVIATTSCDLSRVRDSGAFHVGLYRRLSAVHVRLPALRDRREDIVPLARYFASSLGGRIGRTLLLTGEAERVLLDHDFPGNVSELKLLVQDACVRAESDAVGPEYLVFRDHVRPNRSPFFWTTLDAEGRPPSLQMVKRRYMAKVLRHAKGNRAEAARLLDVSLPTVPKASTLDE
jgi:two-component system response regulator FlrC